MSKFIYKNTGETWFPFLRYNYCILKNIIYFFSYQQIPNPHFFIKKNLQASLPVLSLSFIINKNGDGIIKVFDTKGYIDNVISWIKEINIPFNVLGSSNSNFSNLNIEFKNPLTYYDCNKDIVNLDENKLHLVLSTKSKYGHSGLHYNPCYDIPDTIHQLIYLGAPILAASLLYITIPSIRNYITVFMADNNPTVQTDSDYNQSEQENTQSSQNEQTDDFSSRVIREATLNSNQRYDSILSRLGRLPGEWRSFWGIVERNSDTGVILEIEPGTGEIDVTIGHDAPQLNTQLAESLVRITQDMTYDMVDLARDFTIMTFNGLVIEQHGGSYTYNEEHINSLLNPILEQTADMYNRSHFEESVHIFTDILCSNMDTYIDNLLNGRAWDAGFPPQTDIGGVGPPQQTRRGNRVKKRVRFNLDPDVGSSTKKSKKN